MKSIKFGDYELTSLSRINIILGKNGCGKSSLLRNLDAQSLVIDDANYVGQKRYISPERGGSVLYQANMEQNISSSDQWLSNDRRKNQVTSFRQQSAAIFRQLEVNVLRQIEQDESKRNDHTFKFDTYVNDINELLKNVEIKRTTSAFEVHSKSPSQKIDPANLSSGESELISLAIECLAFEANCKGEEGLLILDEPDVHLHPDLQAKLMEFINKIIERSNVHVILSTHSTPILGALADKAHVSVCFLSNGQSNLNFIAVNEVLKKCIPVFGAHPLTQIFNSNPIFIVEGTDEERIWQQAVRTSSGKIKVYPVECGGKGNLNNYEGDASKILKCVYDSAKGYSLRDGDGVTEEIEDVENIIRFRLKCYASENLLLSDESLASMDLTWADFKEKIKNWVQQNHSHPRHANVKSFVDSNFDRKAFNLKDIRNILLSLLPTNKPWEVIVGQTLAGLKTHAGVDYGKDGSIYNFLGEKICANIFS